MLACAAAAAAFVPGLGTPVRALLALPLVLFLPGYAFTAASLPRLRRWSAEGLAVDLGTSIALTVLAGLALDFTPWGLERRSWALALAGITVVAAAVGRLRRGAAGHAPRGRERMRLSTMQLALLATALLLGAAAVGISRLGAIQKDQQSTFTQLWMLPASESTGTALRIGIGNDEGSLETYRLVLRAGARTLASWPRIVVRAGRRWETEIALPQGLSPRVPVEAELFRASEPATVYRHVTFWPGSAASRP